MARFKRAALAALAGLALAGCAELGAKALTDASALHESAREYVAEVHEVRRDIRRMCWAILIKQVEALEAAGDLDQARQLLKANYPGLVTVEAVKKVLDDPGDFGTEPFGCESLDPAETPEPAPPSV